MLLNSLFLRIPDQLSVWHDCSFHILLCFLKWGRLGDKVYDGGGSAALISGIFKGDGAIPV